MRMACVAFDLDWTIGNFDLLWYLAPLWSLEDINTSEQRNGIAPFVPSRSLQTTLERVKETFANYLLRDKAILDLILRPNLHEVLDPLLEGKRSRHVKTMIIYSNTGSPYTVELAQYLLERIFKTPKLFSIAADWWHPLRAADRSIVEGAVIMHKRIETLQLLFQKGLKTKKKIPLSNILFIDDRSPRHTLVQQIPDGLTYLVPTPFRPEMTKEQKEYLLFLAFGAMQEHGLFENKEYLESRFCHRKIIFSYPEYSVKTVDSLHELFQTIASHMLTVKGAPWTSDSAALKSAVKAFLQQAKP